MSDVLFIKCPSCNRDQPVNLNIHEDYGKDENDEKVTRLTFQIQFQCGYGTQGIVDYNPKIVGDDINQTRIAIVEHFVSLEHAANNDTTDEWLNTHPNADFVRLTQPDGKQAIGLLFRGI